MSFLFWFLLWWLVGLVVISWMAYSETGQVTYGDAVIILLYGALLGPLALLALLYFWLYRGTWWDTPIIRKSNRE